uniref:WD_REPEATS_REGION domain-containing protein n=1 Tax=Syphacia muris TaxID=451379 RepID=A0A0N5AL32_9BILA
MKPSGDASSTEHFKTSSSLFSSPGFLQALNLIFCAGGILVCYLLFGIVQETITRGKYGEGDRFTFTQTLVFVQCLANSIFAYMLRGKTRDNVPLKIYASVALSYVLAMVASNHALQFIPYPTQVLGKSCKPIPILFFGVLFASKKYQWRKYLYVFMIVIGVMVFLYKDKPSLISDRRSPFEFGFGELCLLFSLTMDGTTGAIQDNIRKHYTANGHSMMYYMNFFSSIYLLIGILCTGEIWSFIAFVNVYPKVITNLLLLAGTSALGQYFIFKTVTTFGPLTCSIVTTTRKLFTMLGSVVLFGNVLSSRQFSSLIGSIYKKGAVVFTNDGNSIISSVGNRISVFDLKNSVARTIPIESDLNIRVIAIHPAGTHLFVVNEGGEGLYINVKTEIVLHRIRLFRKVCDAKFSPDGKYIAVCRDGDVQVYAVASSDPFKFSPFMLCETFKMTTSEVRHLCWSDDSRLLQAGCEDKQLRIVAAGGEVKNFFMQTIAAHRSSVVGSFFFKDSYDVISIDSTGIGNHWTCNLTGEDLVPGFYKKDDDEVKKIEFMRVTKSYLMDNLDTDTKHVYLSACAFHNKLNLLVTAFSNGILLLMEMPNFNVIHSIRVSESQVNALAINNDGDWLGIGCGQGSQGQLIVWEWQSETYIMKQQSHSQTINAAVYSPDGSKLVTGAEDGKVKVWSCRTSFCIVTFTEHTSGVSDVCWTPDGKAVLSASLDGVVRAHDMLRFKRYYLKMYRNFRTLVCPEENQLNYLAMDSSGDLVMAASHEIAHIFVWSFQTGQLLDVLSGHAMPISSISAHKNFSLIDGSLVSASWDKTLRIWNVVEASHAEPIELTEEALDVQYSPSGAVIAVLCLDGIITFFDAVNSTQLGEINTEKDVDAARNPTEIIKKTTSGKSKTFTCICFSADGTYILAAGRSNYICMYSVTERIIVKKLKLTCNLSLDGVKPDINRRNFSEFGNMNLVDTSDSEDENGKKRIKLAGIQNNDLSERKYHPEMRVCRMDFSPAGRSFAVCSTEGVAIFSLDHSKLFDPFELNVQVTPEQVQKMLKSGEYATALKMALQLNESEIICKVFLETETSQHELIARSLSSIYVTRLLKWMSQCNATVLQQNFHCWCLWLKSILFVHAREIKLNRQANLAALTGIQQIIVANTAHVSKMCEQNIYGLEYLLAARKTTFDGKKFPERSE